MGQPEAIELSPALRGLLRAVAEASGPVSEAAVVLEALHRYLFASPELLDRAGVRQAYEALASAGLPPGRSGP